MSKPSFPFVPPSSLSVSEVITLAEGIGGQWDFGLNGLGYLLSTLDQESPFEFRSYEIQSIPTQKQRIDDAEEPGEQTLAAWWARGQHSWHEGAGQEVFDSPFSSRFAFSRSKGLNPWTKGDLTLLKDTAELVNHNVDDHHILAIDDALVYTHNGEITRDTLPDGAGETSETTHSGTEINSITSDGEYVYAAFSGGSLGIRKILASTVAAWSVVNAQTAVEIIAFVKGRLLGAKGPSLYEYDLSVTTAPEPYHTDPASAWTWTAITESGPAIYFSGYAGDRSEIYAARLTAQDLPYASVATLGAMRSVWTAPEGETIHSIKGYIGQAVLIGTSRGVRVGTITTGDGDLRVSELIAETDNPVLWFEPQLDYAWFGWTNYDASSTGLGRIDLGNLAYASDLMWTAQGTVKEIAYFQDRLFFVVDEGATSRIIKEHATDLVAGGSFEHDEIRFNTTEKKALRYFDILFVGTGLWSLSIGNDGTSLSPLTTDASVAGYTEEVIGIEGTRFKLVVSMKRNQADATLGPTLKDWRFRAEPRATGRFRYFVTLMAYDFMVNKAGKQSGKVGQSWQIVNRLKEIYRQDSDVIFQPPEVQVPEGESTVEVKMEDLRFKEYAPPSGGQGYGGLVLLVLREVR